MKAVFLDLNGTLVMPVRANTPTEHTVLPGVAEAVQMLNAHGFICPVITVQSGIAKNRFSREDFDSWFTQFSRVLASEGAILIGVYVCPHTGADNCRCSKPQTLLYEKAARDYDIELSDSFVVGDTAGDMQAGRALGCRTVLVRTGWGESSLSDHNAGNFADAVAADVNEAVRMIVAWSSRVN